VAWSVIQAQAAKCIDAVYVSTESEEIADICAPLGANIIWRPPEIQDKAFAANVPIRHALEYLGMADRHEPFLTKLATSPLIFPGDIDKMAECFSNADEVPIGMGKQVLLGADMQEIVSYKKVRDGKYPMCVADYVAKRKQKPVSVMGAMNMMYADAYAPGDERIKWIFSTNAARDDDIDDNIVNYGMLLGNSLVYYVPCEPWQTFDIDDQAGFDICETFMEKYILKGRGPEIYYA